MTAEEMRVRVVFLNHSTAAVHLGGAERSFLRLVEDWLAADPSIEPFVVTKAPRGLLVVELERRGWAYEAVPFGGWARPPAGDADPDADARDLAAVRRIVDILRDRDADVVVTNTLVAPWAAFAAKALDLPHVWFVREYGDLDHGLVFRDGRDATIADIGLLSEVVAVNSTALGDHLVAHGVAAGKLTVVLPRIPVADEVADPPPLEGPLRIVTVGRVTRGKGQDRVIDAVAELRSRGIDVEATFVGAAVPASHGEALRARAEHLGVESLITFVGEQEDPRPFVTAAHVGITASDAEAFGRTTLEYMALGRAVVATRSGGSAEIVVDGVTGWLVDPDAGQELATALARYVRDPALLLAHGRAGVGRARDLAERDDNRALLDRVRTTVGRSQYRLPHAATAWFERPARPVPATTRVRRAGRGLARRLRALVTRRPR